MARGLDKTLSAPLTPPALPLCSPDPRVCACMQTQHKVQLDHRDANPGSIPPPMPGMVPPGEPHAPLSYPLPCWHLTGAAHHGYKHLLSDGARPTVGSLPAPTSRHHTLGDSRVIRARLILALCFRQRLAPQAFRWWPWASPRRADPWVRRRPGTAPTRRPRSSPTRRRRTVRTGHGWAPARLVCRPQVRAAPCCAVPWCPCRTLRCNARRSALLGHGARGSLPATGSAAGRVGCLLVGLCCRRAQESV